MPLSPQRSGARHGASHEPLLADEASISGYSPDTPRQMSRMDAPPDDGDEEAAEAEDEEGDDGGCSTAEHDGQNDGDGDRMGALSEPEFSAYGVGMPPASDYDHYHLHEGPAQTAAHRISGYSSDTSRHDLPRLYGGLDRTAARGSTGAFLSFGGATATTRRPGDAHPTHRRLATRKRVPDRERLRSPINADDADDASHTAAGGAMHRQPAPIRHGRSSGSSSRPPPPPDDPLVWTGGSPATQPISINGVGGGDAHSFGGLPPLLAGLEGAAPPPPLRGPSAGKVLRCSSYCCALGIDLLLLYRALSDVYRLPCRMHKDGVNAVLHCTEANGREGDAHSFFFSYGCVVTWGLSEAQECDILQLLKTAGCAQELLDENEVDDFGYTQQVPSAGGKPGIAKDIVYLSTLDVREKLALSFALAQSVKLGVFERTVEQTIQETRAIPERMAVDGQIRLTRKTITKRIGQLFVDRASINLHSDILDHPEFFWEDDEWLPLYLRASKYLEIDRRAEVLNKRLDIIKELFDMLANELNVSHSNKLEWIIIILIVLEVAFQVLALVLEYGFGND